MTGRIITVNSTRPITSASPSLDAAALIAVALLAIAALVLSVRDARAAYVRALGVGSVASAESLPRGQLRDRMLDRAQGQLQSALDVYPRDPTLWLALARTRYLQATGAEVLEISPPLLQAAIDAARRAEALDPASDAAPAQLAQAMSALPNANRREAAGALARSYLRRGLDPGGGGARIQAAAALWPELNAGARQSALAEACVSSRQGANTNDEVRAAIAANAEFSAQLAAITGQCAPGSSIQSPGN